MHERFSGTGGDSDFRTRGTGGRYAKVTPNTVSRVEQDEADARGAQPVTIEAIKRDYEERGIVFLGEDPIPYGVPGVRLSK
jgi:hypothetical protein